jgi:hypothetical protein
MYKIPKQSYTVESKQEVVRQVEKKGKSPAHALIKPPRLCPTLGGQSKAGAVQFSRKTVRPRLILRESNSLFVNFNNLFFRRLHPLHRLRHVRAELH